MSFIRAKEIPPRSGNWYDYEVKTVHEGKRVIQQHIRYIGKSGSHASLSGGGSTSHAITTFPGQSLTIVGARCTVPLQ